MFWEVPYPQNQGNYLCTKQLPVIFYYTAVPKLKLPDDTNARACIAQFDAPVMPENVQGAKSIMEMVKK